MWILRHGMASKDEQDKGLTAIHRNITRKWKLRMYIVFGFLRENCIRDFIILVSWSTPKG